MRAVYRHMPPHQRTEEHMHSKSVQHYLKPQLLAMTFQDNTSFSGFETEVVKEGTVQSREVVVHQYSCGPFALTFPIITNPSIPRITILPF